MSEGASCLAMRRYRELGGEHRPSVMGPDAAFARIQGVPEPPSLQDYMFALSQGKGPVCTVPLIHVLPCSPRVKRGT